MDFPPCQIPQEPSVDSTEEQFSPLSSLARSIHIVEYPFYFASRKIRVNDKPCFFAYHFSVTWFHQFFAYGRSTFALPDYRIAYGFAASFVPNHSCFPLVCYTYGLYFPTVYSGRFYCFLGHTALTPPNLHWVVLNPSGLGIVLPELLLRQ